MIKARCFGISDVGLIRSNNEDAFLVREDLGVVALADGMGGAAAGELASKYFIDAALEVFSPGPDSKDMLDLLRSVFELANSKMLDHANKYPTDRGLGCTAEMLAFRGDSFFLAHIGDSRTYLHQNQELKLLTKDHSFIQELIDKGQISSMEALHHPMRHVILRALGQEQRLEIETITGRILPGDLFLLCSDGLTDMVGDNLIRDILSSPLDISGRAQKLIDAAKDSGGQDNVSVVLCEFI